MISTWECLTSKWILALLITCQLIVVAGWAESVATVAPDTAPAITIIPGDGMNLRVQEQILPTYVTVTLTSPAHNWFAGTFDHLPVNQDVTIGFSMEGRDTKRNKADVKKWQGLRPVMTYADPTQYASYEWFMKDAKGCWVSQDMFRAGATRDAGTGKVPLQDSIPSEVADQFLSADGRIWTPWREVDAAEAVDTLNIFRIRQHMADRSVTIAMRTPYTYTYEQAFLSQLQAAHCPGVSVDTLGSTPAGHQLTVFRLDPPDTQARGGLPTVLVYAREHATEPDGSWVIDGMIRWLLSAETTAIAARQHVRWLLIPILDPDRSALAETSLGDFFSCTPPIQPEALVYARYLTDRVNNGERFMLAVNLHNMECNEGPNLSCPVINPSCRAAVLEFNRDIFGMAKTFGMTIGDPQGGKDGVNPMRLAGWCYAKFRTIEADLELNTRAPQSRLSHIQLQQFGARVAAQIDSLVASQAFAPVQDQIVHYLEMRSLQRQAWFRQPGHPIQRRTPFDLLTLGY